MSYYIKRSKQQVHLDSLKILVRCRENAPPANIRLMCISFTFQKLPVASTTVETSPLEPIILDKQIRSLGKYTAIILNAP